MLYYVKLVLLGTTPRSVWNLKSSFQTVAWGTLVREPIYRKRERAADVTVSPR